MLKFTCFLTFISDQRQFILAAVRTTFQSRYVLCQCIPSMLGPANKWNEMKVLPMYFPHSDWLTVHLPPFTYSLCATTGSDSSEWALPEFFACSSELEGRYVQLQRVISGYFGFNELRVDVKGEQDYSFIQESSKVFFVFKDKYYNGSLKSDG